MKNYNFLCILCGLISISCVKSDLESSKEDLRQCLIHAGISEENSSLGTDITMSRDFITSMEYFYNKYNSQKYIKPDVDETHFTKIDNESEKNLTEKRTSENDGNNQYLKKTLKVSNDIREISDESKAENKNVLIIEEKENKKNKNTKEKNKNKRDVNAKNCKKNKKCKEEKNQFKEQGKEDVQFEDHQEKSAHTRKDKRDKLIKKLSKEICGYLDSKKIEELFKKENPEKPFKACVSMIHKCSAKFLTGNELYLVENKEK